MKLKSLRFYLLFPLVLASCFGGKSGPTVDSPVECNPEITLGICRGPGGAYAPNFHRVDLSAALNVDEQATDPFSSKLNSRRIASSRRMATSLASRTSRTTPIEVLATEINGVAKQAVIVSSSFVKSLTIQYTPDLSLFDNDDSDVLVRIYRIRKGQVQVLQNLLLKKSSLESRNVSQRNSTVLRSKDTILRAKGTKMSKNIPALRKRPAKFSLKTKTEKFPTTVMVESNQEPQTLASDHNIDSFFSSIQTTDNEPLTVPDFQNGDEYTAQLYRGYKDSLGDDHYHYYNQTASMIIITDDTPVCNPHQNPNGCSGDGTSYDSFKNIREEINGSSTRSSRNFSFGNTPMGRALRANGVLSDFDIDSSPLTLTVNSNETKTLALRYYPPAGSQTFETHESDVIVRVFRIRNSSKTKLGDLTLKKSSGTTGDKLDVTDFRDGDQYTAQLYRLVNGLWYYYNQKAVVTLKVSNAPICDPQQNPNGCDDPGGDYSVFRSISETVTTNEGEQLADFDIDTAPRTLTVSANVKSLDLKYYVPSGSPAFSTNNSEILVRVFRIRNGSKSVLGTLSLKNSSSSAIQKATDLRDGDKFTAQLYRQVDGTWNYYDQKAVVTLKVSPVPICDPTQNPNGCDDPGGDYSVFRSISETVMGNNGAEFADFDIDADPRTITVYSYVTKSLDLKYYVPSGSPAFSTNNSEILIRVFRIRNGSKSVLGTLSLKNSSSSAIQKATDLREGDKFTAQLYRQVNGIWNYYDQRAVVTLKIDNTPSCNPHEHLNGCDEPNGDYSYFRTILENITGGDGIQLADFSINNDPFTIDVKSNKSLALKYYAPPGSAVFDTYTSTIIIRYFRIRGSTKTKIIDRAITPNTRAQTQIVDDLRDGDKFTAQLYRQINGIWRYYDQKAIVTIKTTSIPVCDPTNNPNGCDDNPNGDYNIFKNIKETVTGDDGKQLRDFDINDNPLTVTANAHVTKSLDLKYYVPSGSPTFTTNSSEILVRVFRIRGSSKTKLGELTLTKSSTSSTQRATDLRDGDKFTAQLYRQVNGIWNYYDQRAIVTLKLDHTPPTPTCDPTQNPNGCDEPGGDYEIFRNISETVKVNNGGKRLADFDVNSSPLNISITSTEAKSIDLLYYVPSGSPTFSTNKSNITVRVFRIRGSSKTIVGDITLKSNHTSVATNTKDVKDGDKLTAQFYRQVNGVWNYYDQKAIVTFKVDGTPDPDPDPNEIYKDVTMSVYGVGRDNKWGDRCTPEYIDLKIEEKRNILDSSAWRGMILKASNIAPCIAVEYDATAAFAKDKSSIEISFMFERGVNAGDSKGTHGYSVDLESKRGTITLTPSSPKSGKLFFELVRNPNSSGRRDILQVTDFIMGEWKRNGKWFTQKAKFEIQMAN